MICDLDGPSGSQNLKSARMSRGLLHLTLVNQPGHADSSSDLAPDQGFEP